jgi:hypothetical protein
MVCPEIPLGRLAVYDLLGDGRYLIAVSLFGGQRSKSGAYC